MTLPPQLHATLPLLHVRVKPPSSIEVLSIVSVVAHVASCIASQVVAVTFGEACGDSRASGPVMPAAQASNNAQQAHNIIFIVILQIGNMN